MKMSIQYNLLIRSTYSNDFQSQENCQGCTKCQIKKLRLKTNLHQQCIQEIENRNDKHKKNQNDDQSTFPKLPVR